MWRLVDDDGQSSSFVRIPGIDDPLTIVNMSVWADLESLRHFVLRSGHAMYLRRRREWFEANAEATAVCWWLPAGEIPDLSDAHRPLLHLRDHGPTESDGRQLAASNSSAQVVRPHPTPPPQRSRYSRSSCCTAAISTQSRHCTSERDERRQRSFDRTTSSGVEIHDETPSTSDAIRRSSRGPLECVAIGCDEHIDLVPARHVQHVERSAGADQPAADLC